MVTARVWPSVIAKVSQVQIVPLSRWDSPAWVTYRTRLDKPEHMFGLKIRDKCRILRSETKASPCGWSHWNAPILVTPVLSFWGWRIYSPLTPDSPPTMHSTGNPQSRLNWTWPMVRRDRTPTINGIRAAYCAAIVAVMYAITSVASPEVQSSTT